MDRPQQQELERSGHTPVDQESRDLLGPATMPPGDGRTGRVPPDNRPGHHPLREQDKPKWAGGGVPAHRSPAEAMSKNDLYREAQRLGIRGRSRMTKQQLADAISSRER